MQKHIMNIKSRKVEKQHERIWKTRSTVKPDAVVIDEHSVWVHTDIQEVHESMGEDQSFDGYEFNMTQYEKDEYILMMSEKNASLEKQVTDTQLALCEVYELIG